MGCGASSSAKASAPTALEGTALEENASMTPGLQWDPATGAAAAGRTAHADPAPGAPAAEMGDANLSTAEGATVEAGLQQDPVATTDADSAAEAQRDDIGTTATAAAATCPGARSRSRASRSPEISWKCDRSRMHCT